MFDLTGFQRDLMYVIAGMDEPSGQEVKTRMEDVLGRVSHGQLYPNLNELVEQGFVDKGKVDDRTNSYRLTSTGRAALRERREWEDEQVDLAVG